MAGWTPAPPARRHAHALAALAAQRSRLAARHRGAAEDAVARTALASVAGGMLQARWARSFKGMSEARLDEVLSAWSLRRCRPRSGLVELLRRRTGASPSQQVA
jgi:hypothetical protein